MRISDWSSDVCSSDLFVDTGRAVKGAVVAGATNTANANNERILGSIQQNLIAKADIKDQIGWSTDRALRAVRRQFSSDIANHPGLRSEEHTSELKSLMRNSYAVICLKKKKKN